jgi:hypothetical protein
MLHENKTVFHAGGIYKQCDIPQAAPSFLNSEFILTFIGSQSVLYK